MMNRIIALFFILMWSASCFAQSNTVAIEGVEGEKLDSLLMRPTQTLSGSSLTFGLTFG